MSNELIATLLFEGIFITSYIVLRLAERISFNSKKKHTKYRLYVYNPTFTKCTQTKLFDSKKDLLEYVLSQNYSNIQLFGFREETV